jgi:hypothetical protein
MGLTCSKHVDMRNGYIIDENLKGRDYLRDSGTGGRIILKCILKM